MSFDFEYVTVFIINNFATIATTKVVVVIFIAVRRLSVYFRFRCSTTRRHKAMPLADEACAFMPLKPPDVMSEPALIG